MITDYKLIARPKCSLCFFEANLTRESLLCMKGGGKVCHNSLEIDAIIFAAVVAFILLLARPRWKLKIASSEKKSLHGAIIDLKREKRESRPISRRFSVWRK